MNNRALRALDLALVVIAGTAAWYAAGATSAVLIQVQIALIGFAGIVVTIFGIWIAVIFPVLSGLLVDGKARQEVSQLARYDVLVRALYRACFSLTASIFVFLTLSFSVTYNEWVARAGVYFSWLVFIATSSALWSAVWNGEGGVVSGINQSMKLGMLKRIRSLGRISG